MEHDEKCEQSKILEEVRVRLNARLDELRMIRDKSLCFCWEREKWPGFEVLDRQFSDRIVTGVSLVMEKRMGRTVSIVTGHSLDLCSTSPVPEVEDFSPGNVIQIDFQERRRIIDR